MPDSVTLREKVRLIQACRLCGSRQLAEVLSFGPTPLANAYLKKEELGKKEFFCPLTVQLCAECGLAQLRETVEPETLFRHYLYVSSTSAHFVQHFEKYAEDVWRRFALQPGALVVDVGSNDGILLRPFRRLGARVIGVDPAVEIARVATKEGLFTIPEFFTPALARTWRQKAGPAKVITANNVFAHTPDIRGFVEAVDEWLDEGGVFIFEVQYVGALLEHNLFDIIYHEHLLYYALTPLVRFFTRQGWEIFDVQQVPVHGGSLRVFAQRQGGKWQARGRVEQMLAAEKQAGITTARPFLTLAERVKNNRRLLHGLLAELRGQGKRIVGYGAPAKATTFMYALGLGRDTLEYIVDDDRRFKQGRLMPGTHIPIVAPERLYENRPEIIMILAWNFAEPIMKKHEGVREWGGRWLVPVPEPHLI
jgi:SAM-dependent methyltransferase